MRFVSLLLLLIPSLGFAAGDITITHARSIESVKGSDLGVIYATIENHSDKDISLTSIAANSICHNVELHTHEMQGDAMAMRKIDSIPIPAKSSVELKPGGLHVMLIGLKQTLIVGDSYPSSFTFSDGKVIPQVVQVERRGNE